ncbi:MAG TPA: GDP-L-fucose synthase [Bacteroidia bacterium]|nr:GDP-L-fucose synthase [Bacteroidia bacterium]HRS59639.1 GDP-L-fucose synthase [Bacteroidia bacterium]HRU68994.1 GDP-L-fucose synthase [Bacteroidia bacterium]
MEKEAKIYIAGHLGMVGSAIHRKLISEGYTNFVLRSIDELDLLNQQAVAVFFKTERPEYVVLAAAKVGGILANNTYRAQFIYENLMIQNNVIHQSYLNGVKKLLFLGSSCIYPRLAPQPIREENLLTGLLEETNEPYAIAKIAGIKMCEAYRDQYGCNFISVMPTNLYGPNDNFDLKNSHVLPALIRKFHEAKINKSPYVEIWGTGTPMREFLHVDDMADACVFLLQHYNERQFLNIGCGHDLSIKDLALLVKKIIGYEGDLQFDTSKPDGTPRKLLDVSRLFATGWRPKISLEEGIRRVYEQVFSAKS